MPTVDLHSLNEGSHAKHPRGGFEDLRGLLGQPIAFYRRLAALTGSAKAGVLLGQLLYWTRYGSQSNDGWVHKTATQWQRETGLSRREQCSTRAELLRRGLIEERRAGMPARLHFRLNLKALEDQLDALMDQRVGPIDWGNAPQIAERLGPARAYFPRLTQLTGGVNAALALSRMLSLTRRGHTDPAGWIAQSASPSARELGMTLAEYQHARRRLRALGVLTVRLRGVPARTFVRIECEALASSLANIDGRQTPTTKAAETQATVPENVQTSPCEDATLDCANAPNKLRHLPQPSLAETRELKNGLITEYRLQTLPERLEMESPPAPASCSGEILVFPSTFTAEQRRVAAAMLKGVTSLAQALLDELAARMAMNLVRTSPIGYLQTLIGRARAGAICPGTGSAGPYSAPPTCNRGCAAMCAAQGNRTCEGPTRKPAVSRNLTVSRAIQFSPAW